LPKQQSAWQALGDSKSLNWRTHILFGFPAMGVGVAFDLPRLGGDAAAWLVLASLALAVTIISLEGLSQLLGKSSWQKPKPLTVALILVVAGFLRGATFMVAGGAFEMVPASDLGFRLVGGPVFTLSVYLLMNSLVAAHLAQRELAAELELERENLEFSKRSFESELVRLRDAQILRVRESIIPAVWELGKLLRDAQLSKNASRAIQALRELNDNVVRPLSHNLTRSFEIPTLPKSQTQLTQLGQFVLPSHISFNRVLQLGTLVPFIVIMSYSTVSALAGPFIALLASSAALLLVTFQFWIWRKLLGEREIPLILAFTLSLVIALELGLSVNLLVSIPALELPARIVSQATAFFIVTMTLMFGIAVTGLQRDRSIQELEQVVEDLRLLNTKLRQRVWLSQKTLATELHGSVQGALNASAMRLAQLENPTEHDLERVRQDIDKALSKLGREDYLAGESFEDLLEQICELWDSTCEINYQLSDSAAAVLEDSSATAYCTLEVIREAVNNAIKHGQPKQIDISIAAKEELIELRIENDGSAVQRSNFGLGSQIFAELTLDYALKGAGPIVFEAKLPIGQSEPELQP
jgi:signal transduction histidine kinase